LNFSVNIYVKESGIFVTQRVASYVVFQTSSLMWDAAYVVSSVGFETDPLSLICGISDMVLMEMVW